MLTVEDEGPGIPAGHSEQVFERFYRAEGGRTSGSGLGLAIARELAVLMGGTIEVDSKPGRTVFSLTPPDAQRTARRTSQASRSRGARRSFHVEHRCQIRQPPGRNSLTRKGAATFSPCREQSSTPSSLSSAPPQVRRSCSGSARHPAGSTPGRRRSSSTIARPRRSTPPSSRSPRRFRPRSTRKPSTRSARPASSRSSAPSRPAIRGRGPASSSRGRDTCSRTHT